MTKHLADHHSGTSATRLAQFIRIARRQTANHWQRLWQAQADQTTGNRRVVEFVRIARQQRD